MEPGTYYVVVMTTQPGTLPPTRNYWNPKKMRWVTKYEADCYYSDIDKAIGRFGEVASKSCQTIKFAMDVIRVSKKLTTTDPIIYRAEQEMLARDLEESRNAH